MSYKRSEVSIEKSNDFSLCVKLIKNDLKKMVILKGDPALFGKTDFSFVCKEGLDHKNSFTKVDYRFEGQELIRKINSLKIFEKDNQEEDGSSSGLLLASLNKLEIKYLVNGLWEDSVKNRKMPKAMWLRVEYSSGVVKEGLIEMPDYSEVPSGSKVGNEKN